MFASNMKSSSIEIDGSGITAQKYLTVIENEDFTAAAGGAYFATADVVCTLAAAASAAGQETVVCNTGKGASIKYKTAAGETVVGADLPGVMVNATPGKVDRFISDGRFWYKE
jgi:hypothetical protein